MRKVILSGASAAVTIPKEIAGELKISIGDYMQIEKKGDEIVLRKAKV